MDSKILRIEKSNECMLKYKSGNAEYREKLLN